ncbi:methyltransferase domain-containing protein [Salinarimonas sp.]|uniref:class I SAM-dependent methyltransferase n=1 Tax=Salinarimonas sp. TaxID=2766526 RepID=UPI0032D929E0
MDRRYYATARTEIAPHLPARVSRMLDVGCGDGATTAFVKSQREVAWAGGVEYVPASAEAARSVCDAIWTGDVQGLPLEERIAPESLDLVLCLDVLEHLVDPWTTVSRLSALIAPGGRLIVSVPNVRNWKFIRNLALRGDFHYRDAGLLDRTHLRFFVRDTAIALAESGGLPVIHAGNAHPWKPLSGRALLSRLTFRGLDELMIKQHLVVAERR